MNNKVSSFNKKVEKLVESSRKSPIFAYTKFDWPQSISEECWWFAPEQLSIYGTDFYHQADETTLKRLSKWECTNLFSLNITGEQELIAKVISIINQPMLCEVRDYLHHFIEEESQHMWYFNEFCTRYSGKSYDKKTAILNASNLPQDVELLLIFARITIFEEVGHHFNIHNGQDTRVHPFIAELNRAHQQDEGRHINFGRLIIAQLAEQVIAKYDREVLDEVERQLRTSMQLVVESFYNPAMYRDAQLGRGMTIRAALLADPVRIEYNQNVLLKNIYNVLKRVGLISDAPVFAAA